MKIKFPCDNHTFRNGIAEIRNGNLYIHKSTAFKEVMYELTYMLYGKDECYFCHRKYKPSLEGRDTKEYFSQITLDHLIPQDFGGPTIPDNMRPACSRCNSLKGNLFEDEFVIFLQLMNNPEKKGSKCVKMYKEQIKERQELRRQGLIPCLPKKWIKKKIDIRKIYSSMWLDEGFGTEYSKQQKQYDNYGYCLKHLTVSKNFYLFDGFYTLVVAKMNKIGKSVEIIYLENVIFDGYD